MKKLSFLVMAIMVGLTSDAAFARRYHGGGRGGYHGGYRGGYHGGYRGYPGRRHHYPRYPRRPIYRPAPYNPCFPYRLYIDPWGRYFCAP